MIVARLDGIRGIIFALLMGCAVNILLSHLLLKVEESLGSFCMLLSSTPRLISRKASGGVLFLESRILKFLVQLVAVEDMHLKSLTC